MARGRAQETSSKSADSPRRATTRAMTRGMKCLPFLKLPLEVRDIIYGYAIGQMGTSAAASRLVPVTESYAKFCREICDELWQAEDELETFISIASNKTFARWERLSATVQTCQRDLDEQYGRPLDLALLRTNTVIFAEINDYIRRRVTIGFQLCTLKGFSAREMELFRTAHRIHITVNLLGGEKHSELPGPCNWSSQLHHALKDRLDIQTFTFENGNDRFGTIESAAYFLTGDTSAYEYGLKCINELVSFLKRMPKVRVTKHLQVKWRDEQLLEPGEAADRPEFDEVRQQLVRLNAR